MAEAYGFTPAQVGQMTFAQLYAYLAAEEEVSRVDGGRLTEATMRFMAAGAAAREKAKAKGRKHG